jgi:hypothetical protein
MLLNPSREPQRAGWRAAVWVTVLLSSALVRGILTANGSEGPLSFPLAAVWLIGAVYAVQWTVAQWIGRDSR